MNSAQTLNIRTEKSNCEGDVTIYDGDVIASRINKEQIFDEGKEAEIKENDIVHMEHEPINYKCDNCDFTTMLLNNYQLHIDTCKEITKNLQQDSDKSKDLFENASAIPNDAEIMAGEKQLTCDICCKIFTKPKALKHHKKLHMKKKKKNFVCQICRNNFVTIGNLKLHMKIHKEEEGRFNCNVCGKCFADESRFKEHQKMHNGDKPFKCNICGKGLEYRSGLAPHKRTHTGNNPFQCNLCEYSFGKQITLKNHMKLVHSEKKTISI